MSDTCVNCRYWAGQRFARPVLPYEMVECRRHAPAHAYAPTKWPQTQSDDWCGEFAGVADEKEAQR